MEGCVFCKIVSKKLKAGIVKESPDWICFEDVHPKAPVHLLIIPKIHYDNLHSVDDETIFGKLMTGVKDVVKELGLDNKGYRIVINTGNEGGQTVSHLHLHLLAKRPMGWPPG